MQDSLLKVYMQNSFLKVYMNESTECSYEIFYDEEPHAKFFTKSSHHFILVVSSPEPKAQGELL